MPSRLPVLSILLASAAVAGPLAAQNFNYGAAMVSPAHRRLLLVAGCLGLTSAGASQRGSAMRRLGEWTSTALGTRAMRPRQGPDRAPALLRYEPVQTENILILLFIVATTVALLARRLRLPYTVALVLAGLFLGQLHAFEPPHLTPGAVVRGVSSRPPLRGRFISTSASSARPGAESRGRPPW